MNFLILLLLLFLLMWMGIKFVNFFQLADWYLSRKFKANGLQLQSYTNKEGSTLSYWMGGNGPSLVLIHGFGAPAKFQWDRQLKALVQSYHLIIPNLLYFGQSKASNQDFSPDYQAQCIAQLLTEDLDLKTFHAVGISYGGVVAVMLANTLADKIQKLGICDSPIRFFTDQHIENSLKKFKVSSIESLLVPDLPKALVGLSSIAFHKPFPIPSFVLKDTFDGLVVPHNAEKKALLRYLFEHRTELSALTFNFKCPILLVWGEFDALIPNEIGQKLLDYFGEEQAQLHIIPNAAHMPNLEQSKAFNKVLTRFLKSPD